MMPNSIILIRYVSAKGKTLDELSHFELRNGSIRLWQFKQVEKSLGGKVGWLQACGYYHMIYHEVASVRCFL